MKRAFLATILLIISNIHSLNASVWDDSQSWSLQYEEEFSKWMASPKVHETLFTDPTSPYFGINTDCADTAYAFRAIFAFEHSLPFAMNNPSGNRDLSRTLNNRLSRWDSAGNNKARLVAMITEIGDSVGTENLAYYDTYSPKISTIKSGTLFMYKVKGRLRNFIRHTYNIKSISPIATFDVIYSTQANKAKHLPMLRRKEFEFEHAPANPWGFKKFKWPEHLNLETIKIPQELNPSLEQYDLASTLGENGFFTHVKKVLSTESELAPARLGRLYQSTCNESMARIEYVNQGLNWLKENNNKCMDYEQFDAYSTPQRDENLKNLFLRLESTYKELEKSGTLNSADPNIVELTSIILDIKNDSQDILLTACPINYRSGVSINLATLWNRLKKEKLSSHPNDDVEHRWGEKTILGTRCKRWY